MKTKLMMLCLVVILGGCNKKDKDKSLSITVVEYGTQKPIPNVGIMVFDYESFDDGWGGRDVYYDSVVTNSLGQAFLDGSKNEPLEISLFSEKKNFYDQWLGGAQGDFYVPKVRNSGNIVELIPFAWAKIRFIKKSKLDYIGTDRFEGQLDGFDIYTKDTTVTGQMRGNQWNIITLYPYKDGQALPVKHDSIFPIGHDTTYHEIIW